jgi:STI1 domain
MMVYRLRQKVSNHRISIKLTTFLMMILTHRCLQPGASSMKRLLVGAAQQRSAFIVAPRQSRRPLQHSDAVPKVHTVRSQSSWWGWGGSSSSTTPEKNMVSSTNQQETDGASAAETSSQIENMSAKEMKLELESYGIDTKAFLEKKELRAALEKARAEGLQPKVKPSARASTATRESTSSPGASAQSTKSREERIQEEMNACQSMKARDMKQELEDVWGVSTRSLFEKSEFLKALAEARVDGKQKEKKSGSSGSEGYAEYKNVEVLTDDSAGPRKRQEAQQQQQQSTNPFGGMGGMGGMGGIADMLKNMGGAGGASPFGAGSPFGDGNPFGSGNPFGGSAGGGGPNMMNKVQEMMANPKVRAIMQKAQSNPRIMAKVQECMSNPAAMAKYANDPEVAEIIRELKPYL